MGSNSIDNSPTLWATFFPCLSYLDTVFRTAMFRRFLKLAIAMLNFRKEVYNGGFVPEFKVSMSKEIVPLVLDYVCETRK